MCTLIVAFRQYASHPIVVAANRDEVLTRPATGPFKWPVGFVAPRDEQASGTWLGVTPSGLFVGVTNRFLAPRLDGRASRGLLVTEALSAPSASRLHAQLATLSPERFNAFHLLYADASDAFVTWSDGSTVRQQTLGAGLHVVTERSLGGDDRARTSLITERWRTVSPNGELPTKEALQRLLGTTNPADPLGGVCVEAPEWNYGTRSSLVLMLGRELATSTFSWADGRPDRTPFVDRPDLISALF